MIPDRTDSHPAKGASLITLLAGLWLFLSPWVYGGSGSAGAWNGWIAGAVISLFALLRIIRPSATGLSWLNSILGIWIFFSPWVFGYTGHSGWVTTA